MRLDFLNASIVEWQKVIENIPFKRMHEEVKVEIYQFRKIYRHLLSIVQKKSEKSIKIEPAHSQLVILIFFLEFVWQFLWLH